MSGLTILCVSEGREYAQPFLEDMEDIAAFVGAEFVCLTDGKDIHSGGYIESVLDEAVSKCEDGYVLRLDDDETLGGDAIEWLKAGKYKGVDHWAFRRYNLWPDASHYITNPPLYPDLQTRLSVREKAAQRPVIHSGSPFGTGAIAPVAIHHHKFLARTKEDREALLQRYENVTPGAGSQFVMFSLPEKYEEVLKCKPIQ